MLINGILNILGLTVEYMRSNSEVLQPFCDIVPELYCMQAIRYNISCILCIYDCQCLPPPSLITGTIIILRPLA